MTKKNIKNKTIILKETSFLGQHIVETNKGIFVLEYQKIKPTKIGCKPRIKVIIRNEEGNIYDTFKWYSDEYLDEKTITNTIKCISHTLYWIQ